MSADPLDLDALEAAAQAALTNNGYWKNSTLRVFADLATPDVVLALVARVRAAEAVSVSVEVVEMTHTSATKTPKTAKRATA